MCGIIGVVGDACNIGLSQLEHARDLMVHRGPDQAGLCTADAAQIGFRRLAILDLSEAGHQPMQSADGQVTLAFNGEIYNFQDLRRELSHSVPFRSQTDSEVLLNGYLAWGWERLLRRIDGMFAFVIWDARKRRLYGARDRVGKKPFFYARTTQGLAFGSTLNAVAALTPQHRSVDPIALDAYLTYQAVPAPLTIFEHIRQLAPACSLTFDLDANALEISRYWDLRFMSKVPENEALVLDELDDLVRAAVRRRLLSDVPLGALLSGGVDSSLVVSIMAQESSRPVEAVVIGFENPAFDERLHARKVANRWGINLHEHILEPNGVAHLPEMIWHYGQPMADISVVPTFYVAKAAKEHVTVVLNGDGGDEVFGGYARPVVARAAQYYRRLLPRTLRGALGHGARSLKSNQRGLLKRLQLLAEAGAVSAPEAFVYDRAFRPYREHAYTSAFRRALAGHHPDLFYSSAWAAAGGTDDVDRTLYGDFTTYLPHQLLAKMDVSMMAHSVEARSPLLDKQLIEFAARIPTALRLKGFTTKYLLKRLAERYVPRDVLYRRKQGFVMPAGDWLRRELSNYAEAALLSRSFAQRNWIDPRFVGRMLQEHRSGARNWGEQIWTLFVLEIWARMMLDSTLSRRDSLEALL